MDQAREDGRHIESAVKAVLRLCQVEEAVLREIKSMVGAASGGLQISQYGAGPFKTWHIASTPLMRELVLARIHLEPAVLRTLFRSLRHCVDSINFFDNPINCYGDQVISDTTIGPARAAGVR